MRRMYLAVVEFDPLRVGEWNLEDCCFGGKRL